MSTREQAIKWMRKNPDVLKLFERFGQQLVTRKRKFGINLLRERVRWECAYTYGDEPYKFRNDFSPYVARFLLAKFPEWRQYMSCKLTKDENQITYIENL